MQRQESSAKFQQENKSPAIDEILKQAEELGAKTSEPIIEKIEERLQEWLDEIDGEDLLISFKD